MRQPALSADDALRMLRRAVPLSRNAPSGVSLAPDLARPSVTLVSEGGYPYANGGVSVWCDQLVRAMPGRDFRIVALTGHGRALPVFDLPSNVVTLTDIPLWSRVSASRRPRGRVLARFREVFGRLLTATLSPTATSADFATAMRALYEYAQTENLTAALSSPESVALVADIWDAFRPGASDPGIAQRSSVSLGDAAIFTGMLEHMLRPLSHPPVMGDIVHCSSNGLVALVALGAKWSYNTPVVVSEHGVYLRERYLSYRETTLGWAVKYTLLRWTKAITQLLYGVADLIVPGNVYNRRWQVRLGADPQSIVTVYNGVDPGDFPQARDEPAEPTLVFIGRIDPIKDLETLIRSFALTVAQIPAARLRMFGVAPAGRHHYLARCQELVVEMGLADRVVFEGRSASAWDAYTAGQVVVLSSISEGFPYTVIEAMATGRPTVSTDVGGVFEAVGDTGLVVPARDPQAFSAACVMLLRDGELRSRLGAAARARVLELFTLEKSMSALNAIYDEVSDARPSEAVVAPLVRTA